VGITLAACGLLHPVVAALLMMASSLLVAWSAAHLGTFGACHDNSSQSYRGFRSMITPCGHGVALALQGFLVVSLLDLGQMQAQWLVAGFAIAACAVGWLWYQWERIPHWLDMTVGMITFANLGMLLGWWVDLGFGPSEACSCG